MKMFLANDKWKYIVPVDETWIGFIAIENDTFTTERQEKKTHPVGSEKTRKVLIKIFMAITEISHKRKFKVWKAEKMRK